MNIRIIAVGKIKENYILTGLKEYAIRLSRYCNLELVEVRNERVAEGLTQKEKNIIKNREGQRILSKLPKRSYIIALAIDGHSLSSEELSKRMKELAVDGINDITFIIGGSLGLAQDIVDRSDFKLSFSKMTFPHQLMRMILLEQIYRGFRIMHGEPYHRK